MPIVDKTTELSEEVLDSVKTGQQHAIAAVRTFVDTVEKTLTGQDPSKQQEVIDSALEMADRLVKTEYDFLRRIVQSAGKSLGASTDAK
jgi:hypothetical protein